MRVVAKDPGKPVVVRAAIAYAVCEKICIPVEAHAELAFNSVASTEDGALTAALDTVPKPATLGDGPLSVREVKREGKNVSVEVVASDGKTPGLYVEGPTQDWALPIPTLDKASPPGIKRFRFELDGLPSGATADGATIKLTLVGADKAYEYNVTLP
jgi:DsbC/DsbD-like thiol-disulfide interchange protein